MRPEICDFVLRETNRKSKRVCAAFNNDLMNRFPFASERPLLKTFQPFTEAELLAFFGVLIAAGVHRQNKENLDDMWKSDPLPLLRAAMSRDQFKMMLRFIRFENENTCSERAHTEKPAPIRDIWIMFNKNLEKVTIFMNALPSTKNYFHLEAILNLHSTYHLNLLNMALRFSMLAMNRMHTHCKVIFTLKNQ